MINLIPTPWFGKPSLVPTPGLLWSQSHAEEHRLEWPRNEIQTAVNGSSYPIVNMKSSVDIQMGF